MRIVDARVLEVPARLVRRGLGMAWGAHLVPASPPLARATSGLLRSHEAGTGVGSRA